MMLFWRRWIGNMHRGYQLQLAWIVALQVNEWAVKLASDHGRYL